MIRRENGEAITTRQGLLCWHASGQTRAEAKAKAKKSAAQAAGVNVDAVTVSGWLAENYAAMEVDNASE